MHLEDVSSFLQARWYQQLHANAAFETRTVGHSLKLIPARFASKAFASAA